MSTSDADAIRELLDRAAAETDDIGKPITEQRREEFDSPTLYREIDELAAELANRQRNSPNIRA